MPRRIKLIFNPIANLGKAKTLSAPLQATLEGLDGCDWVETKYPNHAREIAQQAASEGYDLVVAMGGDGTVHEVLNGLMESPAGIHPALGVVPIGSGNDFSSVLGVPPDPISALHKVLQGNPRTIDIGRLKMDNDQVIYWANAVGLGFDTLVTIHSRRIPLVHGFAVYFAAVLQTILLNYLPFHVKMKVDDHEWEDEYIMMVLCNGQREGGGFYVTPNGRPDDGILDYVSVQRISRLRMLLTLPYFMKGTQEALKYVSLGQFHKLELISDRPLFIHVDGEILAGFKSNYRQLSVEVLHDALQFIG
jgi:diacylglycerol kinase (ATP)